MRRREGSAVEDVGKSAVLPVENPRAVVQNQVTLTESDPEVAAVTIVRMCYLEQ